MQKETPKQMQIRLRKAKNENGYSNSQIRSIIMLTIFPNADGMLNKYFNTVQGYMTTAVQNRLHIDPEKFATFATLMGGPAIPTGTPPGTNSEPGTWNYVYPLESTKATFTHPLKNQKDALVTSVKAAVRAMYTDVPDSAITITDTLTLHIQPKSDRKDPTPEPPEIKIIPGIAINSLGGGKEELVFTLPTGDIAKPSADVDIEIAYSLVPIGGTPPAVPPATSIDCTNHQVISAARFTLSLGETAVGMQLVLFARYVYVKHPKQSGAFGAAKTVVVS